MVSQVLGRLIMCHLVILDLMHRMVSGSVGLTDGDWVGVMEFAGTVGSYADGSQYSMSDVDGMMAVEFDPVSLAGFASYAFDMDCLSRAQGMSLVTLFIST